METVSLFITNARFVLIAWRVKFCGRSRRSPEVKHEQNSAIGQRHKNPLPGRRRTGSLDKREKQDSESNSIHCSFYSTNPYGLFCPPFFFSRAKDKARILIVTEVRDMRRCDNKNALLRR